jgi:hypothetical protein
MNGTKACQVGARRKRPANPACPFNPGYDDGVELISATQAKDQLLHQK